MKKLLSLAAAMLLLSSAVIAQESYSETRDVSGFSQVSFAVAGEVYISLGQGYKVVIEGDKDIVTDIITRVSGKDLEIKRDKWFRTGNKKVIVHITMPSIEGIDVSGSGKVIVNDPVSGGDFEINISGSGRVYLKDVTLDDVECDISGSGGFIAEGSGTMASLEVNISGSGSYKGESVKVGTLEASISGSGSCDCNVTEILRASISGSGSIYYSGNPKIDAAISGSGKVKMK
ncbi:MAG: DUF2807 domain-containing protein [Bacteroidales bacterium]|nr:DUF2807 domain-containing protein [Bacteroidales bacterium]